MKYILQVFTGPWKTACYRPEEIVLKMQQIAARIPTDQVILGWNIAPSVYREVGSCLHKAGIRMLLWLPVLAETGALSETEESLDLFGERVVSKAGDEGADFAFGCPSSPRNIRIVQEIYEKYFSGCGFDGVFLDRIRSQSFASGVSGVLSCGCERCRKAFLDRGVDIRAVRERYEQKRDAFFDLTAYPMNGRFELKDPLAQRFFDAKEEIIAETVNEICAYFKGKGLTVGLDLFAPLVSRFVGQHYPLITKNADFIKPMLYRKTEAPAGIGYEYRLFEKYAPDARGRIQITMDKAFLDTQLEAVSRVPCGKYPGIEVNYDENLVRTDAGYITESLSAIRDCGFDGAVLCWDVMRAPETFIEAAAGAAGTGGETG